MLIGRTAVITGGAQGIGLAIAQRFAEHGARIVIGDLDEAKAKEAAASLSADAIGVGCDVAQDADVVTLLDAATAAFGIKPRPLDDALRETIADLRSRS